MSRHDKVGETEQSTSDESSEATALLTALRSDECRDLANAWSNWRGDRLLPRRDEVRIEDIKSVLPGIIILELRSPDELIFRLAGTQITEAMGIEVTGRNYLDFAPPELRQHRAERALWQGRQPCGALFLLPIPFSSGRLVLSEVLSLPCLPNRPDEPMQLITLNCALDDYKLHAPMANPDKFATADEFRFIDIGAGAPDDALNLGDLPPLRHVGDNHRES